MANPAIFDQDVCFRSGEYVQRSVPLLNLRLHGSGGSSGHEDGTRPALSPNCIGDFRVGACRCVPPSWLLF